MSDDVELDSFARTLDPTRKIRAALNIMYDAIDTLYETADDTDAQHRFTTVMQEAHDRLTATETKALTEFGLAEHYVVIRPLSLVDPPAGVTEILAAVRTLMEHGMLVQQPDALGRD
jgi:hypothetical protein